MLIAQYFRVDGVDRGNGTVSFSAGLVCGACGVCTRSGETKCDSANLSERVRHSCEILLKV